MPMPAHDRHPVSFDKLAAVFSRFAERECPEDPLYAALCRIVAEAPELRQLLQAAPRQQQRPNLWLAAVHDRVLDGSAHPLRDYFASTGGQRAPDRALAAILADFVQRERTALSELMRTHSTQTNEIGRCAVLWPALQDIARRHEATKLALLDVGCSAGLNLGVDSYRYDYGEFALGAAAGPGVPVVSCQFIGAGRPPVAQAPAWRLAQRLGIDPMPVDAADAAAVRWLRACIWPSDRMRAARLADAVALARQQRWPVRQESDCSAAPRLWLDRLPDDVLPVIFNSWVLTYFEPAALRRHVETVVALVRERGAVWLSAESPDVHIGPWQTSQPNTPQSAAVAPATWWTLCSRVGANVRFELLARSHAHGRWMEWLGDSSGPRINGV